MHFGQKAVTSVSDATVQNLPTTNITAANVGVETSDSADLLGSPEHDNNKQLSTPGSRAPTPGICTLSDKNN